MVEAYVRGLQEEKVIATLKHFPGHGDTSEEQAKQIAAEIWNNSVRK